ncbi:MAG: beta-ketoacyl-ACP synthase II [Dialister pneumosintes]
MKRRVAITGLGVVSPLGIGLEAFWTNLMAGKSGISTITSFDITDFPVKIAGEVKNFDLSEFIEDKKSIRHMDRNSQFALAAAIMAAKDASFDISKEEAGRVGTFIGTGIGGISTTEATITRVEKRGPTKVNPFAVPMMIANMPSAHISIHFGLEGPVLTDVTACASGNNAVGQAARMIQYGDADIMFAGGTEAAICATPMAGFAAMKALSNRECAPEEASCPFDARRDGFVMGEGSGILILEEWEHAVARGAHIYAELAGYGTNGDAYHITAPRPGGTIQVACMQKALADAGLTPDTISYINAHGTSTHLNDLTETTSIKQLLGDKAYDVPVSSTKSMMGHLLGAAGAVEAIVCALAVENDKIPPTINCKEREAECDLDYVTEGAREVKVDVAMSNAFGFGGHNAVLVMRKPK